MSEAVLEEFRYVAYSAVASLALAYACDYHCRSLYFAVLYCAVRSADLAHPLPTAPPPLTTSGCFEVMKVGHGKVVKPINNTSWNEVRK